MRKAAAYLYQGAMVIEEEYLDVKTFDTEKYNIMDTEYVQVMDELLAKYDMEKNYFLDTLGPINDTIYIDFGSYTHFIVVRFIDKANGPINKVEVCLCEGTMPYIEDYIGFEYMLIEFSRMFDIIFEPVVRDLLRRNGIIATKFVCEYNKKDDALYIDFGSPNAFVVIQIISKR